MLRACVLCAGSWGPVVPSNSVSSCAPQFNPHIQMSKLSLQKYQLNWTSIAWHLMNVHCSEENEPQIYFWEHTFITKFHFDLVVTTFQSIYHHYFLGGYHSWSSTKWTMCAFVLQKRQHCNSVVFNLLSYRLTTFCPSSFLHFLLLFLKEENLRK